MQNDPFNAKVIRVSNNGICVFCERSSGLRIFTLKGKFGIIGACYRCAQLYCKIPSNRLDLALAYQRVTKVEGD